MTLHKNTTLQDYGIQNEETDFRIHVCPLAKGLYIYRTESGKAAIASGRYQKRIVKTGDIVTAEGYAVPVSDISGLRILSLTELWIDRLAIQHEDSTKIKGKKCEALIQYMIQNGFIPFFMTATPIRDTRIQISGSDIFVSLNARIQVKCDYKGGKKERGGTGNLFIQTAECNPFGSY